jgi:hypothetical protein
LVNTHRINPEDQYLKVSLFLLCIRELGFVDCHAAELMYSATFRHTVGLFGWGDQPVTRPLSLCFSLAPQPSLGLGLLHKIWLNFLEASQQFSFLQGRVVSPTSNPIMEDQASVFIPPEAGWPRYTPGHRVPILVSSYDTHRLRWDYSYSPVTTRATRSLRWEHKKAYIRGCIQKFPDWPSGARPANGTALCN